MPEFAAFRGWLERSWYGQAPNAMLQPLSAAFGAVVAARRWAYRQGILGSHHPGVPVIVVGNLAVGGTGKTPLAIWLAQRLRERGARPGVVLRGFGGKVRGPRRVHAGDDARLVGDEAVLIARRSGCPVAVAARRSEAADLLAGGGCNLLIADDGLQHLAMRRDLEIVVIDGARGFGNGALLPAGPLREPPPGRADRLVVVHGEDRHRVAPAGALSMSLQPLPLHALRDGHEQPLEALRGETVHAVAGIGHPERFFALVRALGATPIPHPFADHHRFSAADLAFGDSRRILMTEKDAVKCHALADHRMWYLPVAAQLPEVDAAHLLARSLAMLAAGGSEHA